MSQGFQIDCIRSARLNKYLNLSKIDEIWQDEEEFYRRHEDEFSFRFIPTEHFLHGLSVNRSYISRQEDVLFESKFCEVKNDCLYQQKEPKFKSTAFKVSTFLDSIFLQNMNTKFEIKVELLPDPEECNCSHCLIKFENLSSKIKDPLPYNGRKEFMKKLREHLDLEIITI